MKNAAMRILANKGYEVKEDGSTLTKCDVISTCEDGSPKAFVTIELYVDMDENGKVSVDHKMRAEWVSYSEFIAISDFVRGELKLVDKLNSIL